MDILDRSQLEAYSVCPAQARYRDTGVVTLVSEIAESGELIHRAISETLLAYIDSHGAMGPRELADYVETELMQSRPDLQPDAIAGFRSSIYSWSKFISDIHFQNILRFDGGEGRRSGQLSWEIESLGVIVTSELDLLHSTSSKELLSEVDWKTGHKNWTEADVRKSFQFQFHAWLVFNNYPDVEGLRVVIWNTRTNRRAWSVEFTRRDLQQINSRVLTAVGEWFQFKSCEPQDAPTWPTREKCSVCDAAVLCHAADQPAKLLKEAPEAFIENLAALDAILDERKKLARAYVSENGDIVSGSGIAFGVNKPVSNRKPTANFYETGVDDE